MLDWIRFDRRQYETHTTLQGRRRCGPLLSCDYTIPLRGMVYVLKMLLEKYVDRLQEGAGCEMKGFHHPGGSQQAFLTGLAHLYNLVPYQRRAKHAGQCGVEVEGGRVPTHDWVLNLQILISGGFR